MVSHLVRELGADIGGEAPKFQGFATRVVDQVQQRYGDDAAKTVLQKFMDGIRQAMDTMRGFFGHPDSPTVSQNWVTNLEAVHDTLAKMYAVKFGTEAERQGVIAEAVQRAAAPARPLQKPAQPRQRPSRQKGPSIPPQATKPRQRKLLPRPRSKHRRNGAGSRGRAGEAAPAEPPPSRGQFSLQVVFLPLVQALEAFRVSQAGAG